MSLNSLFCRIYRYIKAVTISSSFSFLPVSPVSCSISYFLTLFKYHYISSSMIFYRFGSIPLSFIL